MNSLLTSKTQEIELIIADDCSTDDLKTAAAALSGISEITEIKECGKGAEETEVFSAAAFRESEDTDRLPETSPLGMEDNSIENSCDADKDPLAETENSSARAEKISLKWVRLDKHSGMAGLVRNRGVDAASSDYISFLDSDDLWDKYKLEKQYRMMLELKNRGVRISHTREKWLRGEKTVSQKSQKHKREGDIFEDALWKCIIGPSTVMMEKSLFYEAGGFREDLEVAEDYELWLKIIDHEKVGYID